MDSTYGASYDTLYHQHWWWRSRERILVHEIEQLRLPRDAQILDVGCGYALFLEPLSQLGDVHGIEVDETLLAPDNPFRDRIRTRPLGDPGYRKDRYDLITACDVIEHIEDDKHAVAEMVRMLKPGGYLLITVPAFRVLWDVHDEVNHHFRRYHHNELRQLLEPLIELQTCRYLFASLFLPKLAVKMLNANRHSTVAQHALPPSWVNRAATEFCCAEYRLTQRVLPPFGTSLLAIGQV